MGFGIAILTISDSASKDSSLDKSGPLLRSLFQASEETESPTSGDLGSRTPWPPGISFKIVQSAIVPDSKIDIAHRIQEWSQRGDVDWIVTTGGTGFGKRDCTPEVNLCIPLAHLDLAPNVSELDNVYE